MPNAPVELLRKYESRSSPERIAQLLEDAREIAERVGLRDCSACCLDAAMETLADELARLHAETVALLAAVHAVEAEQRRRAVVALVQS